MEKLADAPPLAIVAFGVTLAVIFGVRFLGLFAGVNAGPDKARAAAQVATVIVDPTALNKATVAVETHTLAVNRFINVAEHLVQTLDSAVGSLTSSIDHGVNENLNYRKSMERGVEDLVDNLEEVTKGLSALKEEIRVFAASGNEKKPLR